LRRILKQYDEPPEASELLGHVYRRTWYLSWREKADQEARQRKALANSHMAAQSVKSFVRAHKADPGAAYFAGFNALILLSLVNDLHARLGGDLADSWPVDLNEQELIAVVRFCAKNANIRAQLQDDFEQQFWTTTTLSGISLIEKNKNAALQHIRDACLIPGATLFQLQILEERLALLSALDFEQDFISQAMELVDEARLKKERATYQRVFLFAGYGVDKPGQTPARFPASQINAVRIKIENALDAWNLGKGDLAICEGVTEGDILFAEACRKRTAQVRFLLLEPAERMRRSAWPFRPGEWSQRFYKLLEAEPDLEVWRHVDRLGPAFDEGSAADQDALLLRHKNWLFNTACMEAEPMGDRLFGLILCNDEDDDDNNPANPSYFIQRVSAFNDYQGQVQTLRALPDQDAAKA